MESHILYEICAVVATLAFMVITFYLIKVFKMLIKTLKNLNSNLVKVESKIEPISNEAIRLLENSNEIAETVQDKLSDLDPLMGTIANVGATLQSATSTLKEDVNQFKFFHTEKKGLARHSR